MTTKRQAWLYDVGLIESICFDCADRKIYWYEYRKKLVPSSHTLQHSRFAYSCFDGYKPGFERCKYPI